MVVTFVATVRLYLRRVLCATTRRVTIYLFVHFRLDFSTLYYCASHEEQLIDIFKSLLCTSGGFKEERSSREKNTPSRRGFALVLIFVKAKTRFSSPRARKRRNGVLLSSIKIQCRRRRLRNNNKRRRLRRNARRRSSALYSF